MYINVRYCQKRWTNLYGHKEKELLEKTFSYIFQTISKFVIVFVSLVLAKMWIDRVTGQRREIEVRCEIGLKVLLKDLHCK